MQLEPPLYTPIDALATIPYKRLQVSSALLESCQYTAKTLRAHKTNGAVTLYGSRYWSESMQSVAGLPDKQRDVTALYDPRDLARIIVLDKANNRMELNRQDAVGFQDEQAAKRHARNRAKVARNLKRAADALDIDDAALRRYAAEAAEAEAAALEATRQESSVVLMDTPDSLSLAS